VYRFCLEGSSNAIALSHAGFITILHNTGNHHLTGGMLLFDLIAERRIAEAMERGEFDDLPGSGEPLPLHDDPLIPEELRMAYRILKNAGFVPPELEVHKEIRRLEDLLATLGEGEAATRAARKLRLLRIDLTEHRPGGARSGARSCYLDRILQRLE